MSKKQISWDDLHEGMELTINSPYVMGVRVKEINSKEGYVIFESLNGEEKTTKVFKSHISYLDLQQP